MRRIKPIAVTVFLFLVPVLHAQEQPPWWTGSASDTADRQQESRGDGDQTTSADSEESPNRYRDYSEAGIGPFIEEYIVRARKEESVADRSTTPATEPVKPDVQDARYRVQPSDVLTISVWGEPELQREVLVSPDGWITFPLIGERRIENMTVDDIRRMIAEQLGPYINQPAVNVSIKEVQGNRIYVLGKVNRPGVFPFSKDIDVLQALSLAGGPARFAETDEITILRREDGQQHAFRFDLGKVQRGRNLAQNIVLRSGDVVMVP